MGAGNGVSVVLLVSFLVLQCTVEYAEWMMRRPPSTVKGDTAMRSSLYTGLCVVYAVFALVIDKRVPLVDKRGGALVIGRCRLKEALPEVALSLI